ncbi:MAG: hypothetical protein ACHQNA_13515, partial [Acidimicrobiales bacterium]
MSATQPDDTAYDARVRGWAGELRSGSTRSWSEFLAGSGGAEPTAAGPATGPLPGVAQLELVRR